MATTNTCQQQQSLPTQQQVDEKLVEDRTKIGAASVVGVITKEEALDTGGNADSEHDEVIDDWGLSNNHNFHFFAQHEIRNIYMRTIGSRKNRTDNTMQTPLPDSDDVDAVAAVVVLKQFYISCVEALTPIDMIDLGYGIHDSTCHCAWTGAFLFVAAIGSHHYTLLHPYIFHHHNRDDTNNTNDTRCRPTNVLELGCGTGIGSIGLWTAFQDDNDNRERMAHEQLHLTMTDADPEALKLCRSNCELNHIPTCEYEIDTLLWGEEVNSTSTVGLRSPYDVVFATDVLYDISFLFPLLQTAYGCLCPDGYFILAHVPRACYKSTHPAVSNLNDYIIHAACNEGGFQFVKTIHPNECCPNYDSCTKDMAFPKDALNSMPLQEMQDIGASIFIFLKSNTT